MRPYDQQGELLDTIERLLRHPVLSAEDLGRVVLMLDRMVGSGLVTQAEADHLLYPVREG